MKFTHIFLTMILLSPFITQAMEEQEFPVEQSQIFKQILHIVAQSKHVLDAIEQYKKFAQPISKKFYTESMTPFLDEMSKKFPDQDVRVARILDNDVAAQWLKKKHPELKSYKPIRTTRDAERRVWEYIINNNITAVKLWLDEGNDPNFPLGRRKLDQLKLLVSYGFDFNKKDEWGHTYLFYESNPKKGFDIEILHPEMAHIVAAEFKRSNECEEYLRQEGAVE